MEACLAQPGVARPACAARLSASRPRRSVATACVTPGARRRRRNSRRQAAVVPRTAFGVDVLGEHG